MINKDYTASITPIATSSEDMELINRYSRKVLTAEEVYSFNVLLCDNEIDRDNERFDIPALQKLSELFVGKTGIFDHSMKGRDQTSRIYFTEVKSDSSRKTVVGEPYTSLCARAYMLRTEKNADLIAEIDAGIKKEASISCSVANVSCSVCGANLRKTRCEHVKGGEYAGKICHLVLSEPTDAYEWSFVAVPAQKAAGVTKSYKPNITEVKNVENILKNIGEGPTVTVNKSDIDAIIAHMDELENQAKDGVVYRNTVIADTVRLGMLALPKLSGDCLTELCKGLSTERIGELKAAFEEQTADRMPFKSQLCGESVNFSNNNDFKI